MSEDVEENMGQQLPEDVVTVLKRTLSDFSPDKVNIVQDSDMTLDGFFGSCWLVVDDKRLLVVEPERGAVVRDLLLQDIKAIRIRHLYGNGLVEVSVQDHVMDVLRFSRAHSDHVSDVVKDVSRIHGIHTDVVLASGENLEINRCISCGKAIPGDMRVCPGCIEKKQTIGRLFHYIGPYKKMALLAFALSGLGTLFQLLPQTLTKVLVDEVIVKQQMGLLVWVVAGLITSFALSALFNGSRGYLTAKLGQSVLFDLRTNLYDHLQRLSINFFDKRQTGAIMARVIGDVNRLQNFLSNGMQEVVIQFFMVTIICIMLFATNARLAVIALSPLPLVVVLTVYFQKIIRKVWHRVHRRAAELNAILGDTLPGIRVVKAFGRETNEVEKFSRKQREFFDAAMLAQTMNHTFYPSMSFLVALGIMAIWGIGGREAIIGLQNPDMMTVTLGDLVLFTGLLWQLYGPVQRLSQLSGMIQESATSAERIFEVLDNQPERPDAEHPVQLNNIRGDIRFESVSFEYDKGERVLDNIQLHIEPGEMVGFVGASGSGKTTLINLLSRFYPVTEGAIYIDGVNLDDVEIQSLRDQMAVVLQEPFLFHATIAENIAYGNPKARHRDIIWAAKMANAHDFIARFPDGYDTLLGERGTGLSGGQKQRLSIARAILRNPPILILDEATSAVDTVTESLIQDAIDNLVRNRTTLAIAHRLSTLRNADRIVVMDEGKIVEVGSHEELLRDKEGAFSQLVEMQADIAKQGTLGGDFE